MITESAYLGVGVYVSIDQYETVMLSYGGKGAPSVKLNKDAIYALLVFLKIEPLYDIAPLRDTRAEEILNQPDDEDGPSWIDGGRTI